ncbi:MAG: hypothetical protein ACYCPQ_04105 [Elusimicrobiota bacterium]
MNQKRSLSLAALAAMLMLPAAVMAQNGNAVPQQGQQQPAVPVAAPAVPVAQAPAKAMIPAVHPRLDALLKSIFDARTKVHQGVAAKTLDANESARLDAELSRIERNTRSAAKDGDVTQKEYGQIRQELKALYGKYKIDVVLP